VLAALSRVRLWPPGAFYCTRRATSDLMSL